MRHSQRKRGATDRSILKKYRARTRPYPFSIEFLITVFGGRLRVARPPSCCAVRRMKFIFSCPILGDADRSILFPEHTSVVPRNQRIARD